MSNQHIFAHAHVRLSLHRGIDAELAHVGLWRRHPLSPSEDTSTKKREKNLNLSEKKIQRALFHNTATHIYILSLAFALLIPNKYKYLALGGGKEPSMFIFGCNKIITQTKTL